MIEIQCGVRGVVWNVCCGIVGVIYILMWRCAWRGADSELECGRDVEWCAVMW